MIVNVPRNYSVESGITWSIGVKDCQNRTQTVTIIQDKTYETWVDTTGYICSGTTSYVKQQRYTGTTSSSINVPTSEYRAGAVIEVEDSRCGGGDTRWVTSSAYTCVDGDKWSIEEEEKKVEGGTWQKTGVTRLKEMVESASTFCSQNVQYKWELTDKWECYGGDIPTPTASTKFQASYNNGTSYSAECDSSTELTSGDTHPTGYTASAMTSAEIGDCVTSLGNFAFTSCYSLTTCTIGSGVTSIGNGAFSYCRSLTSIDIPNGVTSIGNHAFRDCSGLTNVTIGNGVTSIDEYAFYQCTSLPNVTIPDSVTSLGISVFDSCSSLTSCTIGSGVTSIGDWAFYECTSLTSIAIPNGVTSIASNTFLGCYNLTSCTIGSGVTSIGNYAFCYCGLTSITIPSSVTSIGAGAFQYCTSLTSITVNATTPPNCTQGAFDNTNNCKFYVPAASVDAYKAASGWSDYASRIQAIP